MAEAGKPPDWFDGLYEMSNHRKAVSVMFRRVDELLYAGHDDQQWPELECLLKYFDVEKGPLTLRLGVLSICLPIRHLAAYRLAFDRMSDQLTNEDPQRRAALLSGLEPRDRQCPSTRIFQTPT